MKTDLRVVSFDLDGVLFDGPSATYPVAHAAGLEKEFMLILQEVSESDLPFEESIRKGSAIWKGVPTSGDIEEQVTNLELMSGAEETITELKEWGYLVGCISSGVSQFFMKPLKKRLQLDFAESNILGESEGKHDGSVSYVMDGPQKAVTIQRILEKEGYTTQQLASIGDGENDIEIFSISEVSIAFNPITGRVSEAADITIRSHDLRDILPHFHPDFP